MTLRERLSSIGQIITTGEVPTKVITEKRKGVFGGYGFLDFFRPSDSITKTDARLMETFQEWVFTNVTAITEETSKVEFELFSIGFKGGEVVYNKVEDHPLLSLLDRFNPETTKSEGIYTLQAHLELIGNSFLLTDKNINPTQMWIIPAHKVELILGDFDRTSRRMVDGYKYKDNIDGEAIEETYPPELVIHTKVPDPANTYQGKGVPQAIWKTIETEFGSAEASRVFYERGMIDDFALVTEQRFDDDRLKLVKSELKAAHSGVKNAYNVPIFHGGLKPESLKRNNREMQFIEQQKWLRDKIMAAFKNTPASLGIVEDVNRANAEATLLSWKQTVIKPKLNRIVDSLNEKLVPMFGNNLILGYVDPVPEDEEKKISKATRLKSAGIITRNEARELVGYDDVVGGDEFPDPNPLGLRNINVGKHLRQRGIYKIKQQVLELKSEKDKERQIKQLAKAIVSKKRKEVKLKKKSHFTAERLYDYWHKQIEGVETVEKRFQKNTEQFIERIVDEGLSNINNEEARKTGQLVDREKFLNEAEDFYEPLLTDAATLAGNDAYDLIGIEVPYIPTKQVNIRDALRTAIVKFATSLIDTDIDVMTAILADGLSEGKGIPVIRREIQSKFEDFSKMQAERITRTEVIKASNLGALDAFEQSGVVEGKQWLTGLDDRVDEECASYEGKIVSLESTFTVTDYDDIPYPPLHPNCRCIIVPVLKGENGIDTEIVKSYAKIKLLESKADKRKKKYKELKESFDNQEFKLAEAEEYIKELENLIGV